MPDRKLETDYLASRGLRQRGGEPRIRAAMKRYQDHVRPGPARLAQLLPDGRP